jgi:hypothetical protein
VPRANVAGDLHSQNPAPHLDTHIGPPLAGRWGGERPDITPARAKATAEKRAYARELHAGTFRHVAGVATFARVWRATSALQAIAADASLATLPPRTAQLAGTLRALGEQGEGYPLLTHAELAAAMGTTVATARRAMAVLVAQKRVAVLPYFDPNDPALTVTHEARVEALARKAPHSRRGNLYTPLLNSTCPQNEQASGTVLVLEHERSGSSHRPARSSVPRPAESVSVTMAVHGCGRPEGRQAKAESPADALPVARQAETRSVAGTAPEVGGVEEAAALIAELAVLTTRYDRSTEAERTSEYLRELAREAQPRPTLVPACRVCGCGVRAGRTICRQCAQVELAAETAAFEARRGAKKGDGGAAS